LAIRAAISFMQKYLLSNSVFTFKLFVS